MEAQMKTIEMTGTVDEKNQLHLDQPLPIPGPVRVKVAVTYAEDSEDITESEWMAMIAMYSIPDLLADPSEDIYTLDDGEPLTDAE